MIKHIFRVGQGYDLHRLATGRPLILAGVLIPFDRGLAGHSDADVVVHAIMDALLGATALGDIGQLFPDTDPVYENVSSIELLDKVVQLVTDSGWRVVNSDCTIIAELPKLSPYAPAMRENLSVCLKVETDSVSIKAKTNEGLDSVGRGEAIASHAVVLIAKL